MKTALVIITATALMIYASKPTISLKPLSISFGQPFLFFAIFFLALAVLCCGIHFHKISYQQGFKAGSVSGYNSCVDELSMMAREIREKNSKHQSQKKLP